MLGCLLSALAVSLYHSLCDSSCDTFMGGKLRLTEGPLIKTCILLYPPASTSSAAQDRGSRPRGTWHAGFSFFPELAIVLKTFLLSRSWTNIIPSLLPGGRDLLIQDGTVFWRPFQQQGGPVDCSFRFAVILALPILSQPCLEPLKGIPISYVLFIGGVVFGALLKTICFSPLHMVIFSNCDPVGRCSIKIVT